jgi:hypothetical protein
VERRHAVRLAAIMLRVVGDNRKLLIFKLEEVPELARGQGSICSAIRMAG